eukprot:CAMPEP_0182442766 /NCGR_PEP_ID=MMETSP1172-20130603/1649_1 /TAXON_ID=708627 /ORGANISM="Timspurckia oligopyrenoides, Strain CCMP3278" /LENGTH=554 /DNA_ID=CAMNT_0024637789 /DNA_START=161 /DNA_END=1825 /DNA_ORIENTATION=+
MTPSSTSGGNTLSASEFAYISALLETSTSASQSSSQGVVDSGVRLLSLQNGGSSVATNSTVIAEPNSDHFEHTMRDEHHLPEANGINFADFGNSHSRKNSERCLTPIRQQPNSSVDALHGNLFSPGLSEAGHDLFLSPERPLYHSQLNPVESEMHDFHQDSAAHSLLHGALDALEPHPPEVLRLHVDPQPHSFFDHPQRPIPPRPSDHSAEHSLYGAGSEMRETARIQSILEMNPNAQDENHDHGLYRELLVNHEDGVTNVALVSSQPQKHDLDPVSTHEPLSTSLSLKDIIFAFHNMKRTTATVDEIVEVVCELDRTFHNKDHLDRSQVSPAVRLLLSSSSLFQAVGDESNCVYMLVREHPTDQEILESGRPVEKLDESRTDPKPEAKRKEPVKKVIVKPGSESKSRLLANLSSLRQKLRQSKDFEQCFENPFANIRGSETIDEFERQLGRERFIFLMQMYNYLKDSLRTSTDAILTDPTASGATEATRPRPTDESASIGARESKVSTAASIENLQENVNRLSSRLVAVEAELSLAKSKNNSEADVDKDSEIM